MIYHDIKNNIFIILYKIIEILDKERELYTMYIFLNIENNIICGKKEVYFFHPTNCT